MAIIGIDLGTTNSACGVWKNGKAELIPNRLGELLTPSAVGYNDQGNIVVGRTAKERLIAHSTKTVACFKRLMGSNHKVRLDKTDFTATELSSFILRSLKEDAEAFLNEPVEAAVISVPAYFNDNQRHATKLAGELAGLKVDRLINEPTAAAMAYGLNQKDEGTFLVLDMGGGTFDVSLLEFFEGVMEVHASAGDNFLGGEDFIDAMVDDVLQKNQLERDDLSKQELNQLYMQMETVKRSISTIKPQQQYLDLVNRRIEWQVDNVWFSRVITPLLLRVKRPIETALRDAKMSPNMIDDIILVGGSTKLQLFRDTIARIFNRLPSCNINPDTVVAMGAAIQAGLLSKDSALDDVVLTDVCPYTLGTGVRSSDDVSSDYFLPIIERNSTVPTSIVRSLVTANDNQTKVNITIYQGESRLVDKNVFLGKLEVPVPKGPAGKEAIDVRYSYDMNGLLEVDVTVCSTGQTFNKLIENTPGTLTKDEMDKARAKLAKLKFHPREQEENQVLLAKGERLFESSLGENRDYIASIMHQFEQVLAKQNQFEIEKYRVEVKKIFKDLDSEEWI